MPAERGRRAELGSAQLRHRRIVITNWRDSAHPKAGGAERYCESVAAELARLGAHVTLLTSRPEGAPARERAPWGRIVRVGGTLTTYPRALLWLARRRKLVDGVVDSENGIPYFSPLALGRRVPVILLMHHVHQQQFDLYFPAPFSTVGRFLEKHVTAWVYGRRPVCAVSPSTRRAIRQELKLKGPIFIAPNGLDREIGRVENRRAGQPRIVCVARMVPHKQLNRLVEALPEVAAKHPGVELHLVGEGESRPHLEQLARDLDVESSVFFHGRLPDAERDELVCSSWLTVNPSAGEGWGLTVVEAAALGVPAVAFRVPGLEDSVCDGETGWLVEQDRPLAEVINEALDGLSDVGTAERWAARCRSWAHSFSWPYAGERLAEYLESERQRIRRGYDERRKHSDAASVVTLPSGLATPSRLTRLRHTDQVRMDAARSRAELLLAGADEADARKALTRLGIEPCEGYRVRVARYPDHLGWQRKSEYLAGHTGLSSDPRSSKVVAPRG